MHHDIMPSRPVTSFHETGLDNALHQRQIWLQIMVMHHDIMASRPRLQKRFKNHFKSIKNSRIPLKTIEKHFRSESQCLPVSDMFYK